MKFKLLGLDGLIDLSVEKALRPERESYFRRLIETELSRDLEFALKLSKIRPNDRTDYQQFLVDMLMKKYCTNQKCSSDIYSKVSKPLRIEYNIIHKRIRKL